MSNCNTLNSQNNPYYTSIQSSRLSQLDNLTRFQRNIAGRANKIILDESHTDSNNPYVLTLEDQCNQNLTISTPVNKGSVTKNYFINIPLGAGNSEDARLWKAWKIVFGFSTIPIEFAVDFSLRICALTTLSVEYAAEGYDPKIINPFDYISFPNTVKNSPTYYLSKVAGIAFGDVDAANFVDDGKEYNTIYPQIIKYLE